MEFAKNLREFRRKNNLTQEQLANLVSVSGQAVSKWETSDTLPDTALLPEIAKALNTSIDALFSYRSSDNMNVFLAVQKYITKPGTENKSLLAEQIERIYNLMIAGEKSRRGYVGSEEEPLEPEYWDYYSDITAEPRYDIPVAKSQTAVLGDEAAMWMFESRLFPYAAVLLQPEEGYEKIFKDNKNIENLFSILGDHDVYKCVMYLLTQEPKNIELSALLVKAGVSASRMDEIGEKLSQIDPRSVKVWEDSIDGEIYRIVSYKYSCSILMLLAAAYACSVSQNAANSLNLVRKSPIL